MTSWFIAGTDTGVGKTRVACQLLAAARLAGLSTAALKPIAAGAESTAEGLRNDDALALQQYCHPAMDYEALNPVCLAEPIAPHLAAREAAESLNLTRMLPMCRDFLALNRDFSLIEGAGGWHVPLNDEERLSDLVIALELPVILVVGMRLGCLSHALLTAEAIEGAGLKLAGWVANHMEADMPYAGDNVAYLKQSIAAPLLGEVPYNPGVPAEQQASLLDLALLQ